MTLGIIVGTTFRDLELPGKERSLRTKYGSAVVRDAGDVVYLQRHGPGIPPHRINYKANIEALRKLGVEGIVGVSCTGGLRKALGPGTLLVPDDYLCFARNPTFFDRAATHIVPGFDEGMRGRLLRAAAAARERVRDGGVYVQTPGPRYETKAEVLFLAPHGHVVGMTVADEATLAKEAGIPYAVICSVDNYANGIGVFDEAQVKRHAKQSAPRILRILQRL